MAVPAVNRYGYGFFVQGADVLLLRQIGATDVNIGVLVLEKRLRFYRCEVKNKMDEVGYLRVHRGCSFAWPRRQSCDAAPANGFLDPIGVDVDQSGQFDTVILRHEGAGLPNLSTRPSPMPRTTAEVLRRLRKRVDQARRCRELR